MSRKKLLSFCLIFTVAACTVQNQSVVEAKPTITPFQFVQNTPTSSPTATTTPTTTPTPFPPTSTVILLPAVPEEYLPYTIYNLRTRSYGGGQIEVLKVLEEMENFTRYEIRYPSDELNIYGFMNIPKGTGPFPIIIMLHGYGKSSVPTVLGHATDGADIFADQGYVVLHPNMRGYPPSDSGDNLYRVGLAVDILNLIALVKDQANLPDELKGVDPTRIGLLGQSLGGGVALRVATVNDDIKAMVLYSSISADERKNAELFYSLTEEQIYLTEMETPPDVLAYISPLNYFDKINASVKLYHSLTDDVVPPAWATETCEELEANGIDVDCFYYIGADHTFSSDFQADFRKTMLAFFEAHLKEP
jgi:dipeptidyl aminopeptidase/acylaminoacyl peptidase